MKLKGLISLSLCDRAPSLEIRNAWYEIYRKTIYAWFALWNELLIIFVCLAIWKSFGLRYFGPQFNISFSPDCILLSVPYWTYMYLEARIKWLNKAKLILYSQVGHFRILSWLTQDDFFSTDGERSGRQRLKHKI